MVVVSKSSGLSHVEVKSETEPSADSDAPVDQVERGIVLLESKVQKIQQVIYEWNDPSPSEAQQRADEELSQLLALVRKLTHEGPESFLPRINTNCSNAIRKGPKAPPILMFGRKNVFLKNVARWAQSTHSVLSEKEQQYTSLLSNRTARIKCEETTIQLVNELKKTLEKSHEDLMFYGRFYNIPHKEREYLTVPRPFYGLSEEPMGEHAMAKVEVKMGNPQELVKLQVTKTVHSYLGASTESPPEVWLNQIRQHRDSPQAGLVHVAQLLGYNRCGHRYDLIFHGPLIPFEEELHRLYKTQPLRRVELISKTTWKLDSARSYFADQLKFSSSHPAQLYWFLIPMLHFNEEENEMVICGDLSRWMKDDDILAQSRDAAKLRLPAMFQTSALTGCVTEKAPRYPNFSRVQDVFWDSSMEERRSMILEFYKVLARTFEMTEQFYVPFFMRGIHVDPRVHKPCNQSWCRPMSDIWDDSVTCLIQIPARCSVDVPLHRPGGQIAASFPDELASDSPRYLQVLTSIPPHCRGPRIDPTPLSLIQSSLIWFSQAGRIFSSPQFQKSGLKKSDILYVKTRCLHSAWMIDPPSADSIPDDLSLELLSFIPHMNTNGIHVGPTKWTTADPLHRYEICESSWTMQKCFYCTAQGFYWDDAAYKALDDFHRSLGIDPSSGEIAKFLGYPLFDINDLLHTRGWTCSHPTIQDSVTAHTLTYKDFEVTWDPSIHCANSMIKDGISNLMNVNMRKYFDEGYLFFGKEQDHCSPAPLMYTAAALAIMSWAVNAAQFLFKIVLGWPV